MNITLTEIRLHLRDHKWQYFIVEVISCTAFFVVLDYMTKGEFNFLSSLIWAIVLAPAFLSIDRDGDFGMKHYYFADGQYSELKSYFESKGYQFRKMKKYELGKQNKHLILLHQLDGVVKVSSKDLVSLKKIPEYILPVQYTNPAL